MPRERVRSSRRSFAIIVGIAITIVTEARNFMTMLRLLEITEAKAIHHARQNICLDLGHFDRLVVLDPDIIEKFFILFPEFYEVVDLRLEHRRSRRSTTTLLERRDME